MPAKTKTVKGAKKPATATKKSASAKTQADTCTATTTRGTSCSLKPQPGSDLCARHADTVVMTEAPTKKDVPAKIAKTTKKESADKPPASAKKATTKATKTTAKKDSEIVDEKPAKKTTKRTTKKSAKKAEDVVVADQVDATLKAAAEEVEKVPSKDLVAERDTGRPKRFKPKAPGQRTLPTASPSPAPVEAEKKEEEKNNGESNGDPDYADYVSSYSGIIEASPYEDQITTEMAIGVEDIDENEDGPGQERPRMTEDEARLKAIEIVGPAPDIIPEEDVHDKLGEYERRIQGEMRRLMGGGSRRRERRGGRGRRGGGGGGGGGQRDDRPRGQGQGQGQGRRRGGRGGRGGGRRDGGRQPGERRGPSGGGGGSPNVSRDSPLANNRPSQGPKRGFQPRKRREPDV